jgi:glutamate racemase
MSAASDDRPVGVFDSGLGGLTVARAVMDLLPDEDLVYFGDTARGPYGPRDLEDVRAFTREIMDYLTAAGAKAVVAACNTATAAALETAEPMAAEVPVIGVIAPAVEAARRATRTGRIGVIGTIGTIESGAYEHALALAEPDVKLFTRACPRFVELVEAGRTTDAEVFEAARTALAPLRAADIDTLILGCTHYPLLTGVLSYVMGPDVVLISSAEETARRVFASLVDHDLLADGRSDGPRSSRAGHRFVVSGDGAEFGRLASRFLGPRRSEITVDALGWPA